MTKYLFSLCWAASAGLLLAAETPPGEQLHILTTLEGDRVRRLADFPIETGLDREAWEKRLPEVTDQVIPDVEKRILSLNALQRPHLFDLVLESGVSQVAKRKLIKKVADRHLQENIPTQEWCLSLLHGIQIAGTREELELVNRLARSNPLIFPIAATTFAEVASTREDLVKFDELVAHAISRRYLLNRDKIEKLRQTLADKVK